MLILLHAGPPLLFAFIIVLLRHAAAAANATSPQWALQAVAPGTAQSVSLASVDALGEAQIMAEFDPAGPAGPASRIGPLELHEGENHTFAFRILSQPVGPAVTVTVRIACAETDCTFRPQLLRPAGAAAARVAGDEGTLTVASADWDRPHFVVIHLPDDDVVNPRTWEPVVTTLTITGLLNATTLEVVYAAVEDDQLNCKRGAQHLQPRIKVDGRSGAKSANCAACQAGTFQDEEGQDLCEGCAADSWRDAQRGKSQDDCTPCGDAMSTYGHKGTSDQALCLCIEGHYPLFATGMGGTPRNVTAKCLPCPKGGTCLNPSRYNQTDAIKALEAGNVTLHDRIVGDQSLKFTASQWLVSKQGWWKVPWVKEDAFEDMFYKCINKAHCPGNNTCAPNREGTLCATCMQDYYLSGSACVSCIGSDSGMSAGIIAGIIFLVAVTMYGCRKQVAKYRSAWRDCLRVVKILIDFWQVNTSMPSVMPIAFPAEWVTFLRQFDFVNMDISTLIGLKCVAGTTCISSFVIMSAFPFVAFVLGYGKFRHRRIHHHLAKKAGKLTRGKAGGKKKDTNKAKDGETKTKERQNGKRRSSKDAASLTPEQKELRTAKIKEGLKIAFNIADADNSGFIDVHEFAKLVRTLGHKKFQDKHARKLFAKKTQDGDQFLDQEEFFAVVLDRKNKVHIDEEVIAWSTARRDLYQSIADVSQLLMLVHTPVARNFFQYFNCVDVRGQRYLRLDLQISCDSNQTYITGQLWAWFVGVFFVFGFPGALFYYLFKHRKELYAVRVTDKIGFMYDRFIKGAEFWELHELGRKMALTGLSIFLRHDPQMQVMVSALVCVVAQVNLNYFKPHKNKVVFSVAEICFTGITVKYLTTLLLTGNVEASKQPSIGMFMIIIDMAVTITGTFGMFLAFFVLWRKVQAIAKAKKARGTASTKITPASDEEAKQEQLMNDRARLIEDITNIAKPMICETQKERTLHAQLLNLLDIERALHDILGRREEQIEDVCSYCLGAFWRCWFCFLHPLTPARSHNPG